MRVLVLIVLANLFIGCMSITRTREVHCLGTLMMDVSESKQEMESIRNDWRAREHARVDQSSPAWSRPGTGESTTVPHDSPIPVSAARMPGSVSSFSPSKNFEEAEVLYRRLMQARARHDNAQAWYTRVAGRVQTRFEEDDMLYSALGMFVTAPASLIFYPLVRWNVRSVLWDGVDPDADDDQIQRFCLRRLDRGSF